MLTAEEGARTGFLLATSPDLEGVTGRYFVDLREAPSSEASRDAAAAARLWRVSVDLTGVRWSATGAGATALAAPRSGTARN
jgi:hypothetical protein